MKVYVASEGDYSDYHIVGVFSTRAKAKKGSLYKSGCDGYIEVWEVDPEIPQTPPGMKGYQVQMEKDGNVRYVYERAGEIIDKYGSRKAVQTINVCPDTRTLRTQRRKVMVFYMFARSKEHAIKIANERRLGLLASDMWLKDKGE